MSTTRDRGEYRPLYVSLVDGPQFQQLSAEARLVLMVLKLRCDAAGIKVLPGLRAALEEWTALTPACIATALDQLVAHDWLRIEKSLVWIVRGLEFEPSMSVSNPKHRTFIRRLCDTLPSLALVDSFRAHYAEWFSSAALSDTPTEPIPDPAHDDLCDTLSDTLCDTLSDRVSVGYPIPNRITSTSTSTTPTTKAAAARVRMREELDPETQPDADPLREQELLAQIPIEQQSPITAIIAHVPPDRRRSLIAMLIGYLHGQGLAGGRPATPIDLAQACQEYLAEGRSASSERGYVAKDLRRFVEKSIQQRLQGLAAITSPTAQQEAAQLFDLIAQHGLGRAFGERRTEKLEELARLGVIPDATHVATMLTRCSPLSDIVDARSREQAVRLVAERLSRPDRTTAAPALRVVS